MKRFLHSFYLLFFLSFSTFLAAQPVNDNCVDAITIMVDEVVDFTTVDATDDGAYHPNCFGTNDSIPADVWFVWTAPADGGYNWSNCATADYDSRIAIYENATTCPPSDATLIGCNDDGPDLCTAATSTLSFVATEGSTYTFRMGGFSNDPAMPPSMGTGTVVLTALPDGPENNSCVNATPIDLGTDYTFANVGAFTDGPNHVDNATCFAFGFPTIEGDIWYTYTAGITGTVRWNTCGMINMDSRMAVYAPGSPCPPKNDDLYACNDDAGCPDFHSAVNFEVVEGETYLLRLGGFIDEFGNGTFELIEITPPVPPVNDNCAEATQAFVISEADADFGLFGAFEGTTLHGTAEGDFELPVCFGGNPGGDFSDVWYSFDNLTNDTIEIRFSPTTQDALFYVELYEDCGVPADTLIGGRCFRNESLVDSIHLITGLADVPTNYLLRVTTRLTTEIPGDFIIQFVGKDFVVSTKDQLDLNDLSIYPNPVNDRVQLNFSLTEPKDLSISLMNSLGSTVYSNGIQGLGSGEHTEEIDMSGLAPGIYFVSFNDGVRSRVEKIIKL